MRTLAFALHCVKAKPNKMSTNPNSPIYTPVRPSMPSRNRVIGWIRFPFGRSTLTKTLVRALVACLVGLTIAVAVFYTWAAFLSSDIRRRLSPDLVDYYTKFLNSRIEIPFQCLPPHGFDSRTISNCQDLCDARAAELIKLNPGDFRARLQSSRKYETELQLDDWVKRLNNGGELTTEEWTSASEILAGESTSTQILIKTVESPTYEAEVFFSPFLDRHSPGIMFSLLNSTEMSAYLSARNQNSTQALEAAALGLKLAKTKRESFMIVQVVKCSCVNRTCKVLLSLLRRLPSSAPWSIPLKELSGEQFTDPMILILHPCLTEIIEIFHVLQFDGPSVYITSPTTGRQLVDEYVAYARDYNSSQLQKTKSGSSERARVEHGSGMESLSGIPWTRYVDIIGGFREHYVCDTMRMAILHNQSPMNKYELLARSNVSTAWLRMTRLTIAETAGTETSRTKASLLMPTIVGEGMDPFTTSPLRRAADGTWYSVGPDRKDNDGKLIYDPTNGTYTAGDIVAAPLPIK